MEPFLKKGDVSGKIVCPNEKCRAKIGNYDWAGVQCGCKEWVTPVRYHVSLVPLRHVLMPRASASAGAKSTRCGETLLACLNVALRLLVYRPTCRASMREVTVKTL